MRSVDWPENEAEAGSFGAYARNATQTCELRGYPNGTLTWGEHNVITSAGGTMTGALTFNAGFNWPAPQNITCTATANNTEWSIDLNPGTYTGTYFHIWSTKLGKSILQCYPDSASVVVPNGSIEAHNVISKGSYPVISTIDTGYTKGMTTSTDHTISFIQMCDKNGAQTGTIFTMLTAAGNDIITTMRACRNKSTLEFAQVMVRNPLSTYASFHPGSDNGMYLGIGSNRWKQIYAVTTTIATSDERLKDNIESISDEVLDTWSDINWYQFQFKDAIEEKGENARIHTGAIAQRIKSVFENHNIDPFKYGLLCYDEWEATKESKDENGDILIQAQEAGNRYSLRYEEALCMEAAWQRRKNKQLENKIEDLEEKIKTLENMISK